MRFHHTTLAAIFLVAGFVFFLPPFLPIANADTVTVNCSGTSGAPTAVDEASLAADDVTFSDTGGDGYCEVDASISAASVVVGTGVILTHTAGDADGLTITTTGNMTITGDINVDEKGCGTVSSASTSPNGSNVCSNGGAGAGVGEGIDSGNGAGGAGHGGAGGYGKGTSGVGSLTYDSTTNPVLFGAQGGGDEAGGFTAPGGGLVKLTIGGNLTWSGAITARGADGWSWLATATGGSAGGSINIQVVGSISGNGTMAADGGNGATFWNTSGGGGGGLIYVQTSQDSTSFLGTYTSATAAPKGTAGGLLSQDGGNGVYTLSVVAPPPTLNSAATGVAVAGQTTVNRLVITFSAAVDIVDVGNAGDGLDVVTLSASSGTCTVSNGEYDATNTTTLTLTVSCDATNNTGITITPTYTTAGASSIVNTGVSTEMSHGTTVAGTDGAAPAVKSSAGRYTLDNNNDGTVDFVKLVFTESVLDSSVAGTDFCVYDVAGACLASGYAESFTSLTPNSGNETDTANDATVYIGITEVGSDIDPNKTDYQMYIQVSGTVTDAVPNTSSAEGATTQSTDGAAPVIASSSTGNTQGPNVNRLVVNFSEQVDITDASALDGFDALNLINETSGSCTIDTADVTDPNITSKTFNVTCTTANNTAVLFDPQYATAGSSTIIDEASNEMRNAETVTATDNAEPYPISLTYKDVVSVDGMIDRVDIVFSEPIILNAYGMADWVFSTASEANLDDTGASVSTSTLLLTVSADANETGTATPPILRYINGNNALHDAAGAVTESFNSPYYTVSDGAAPRPKTVTFYDASSSDRKLDIITVVYTENISAVVNGAADWAVSSAANFSSLVEGTVECNSGSAGANECDYNFTTSTIKTNVGDLTLTYTAGTSVTDGTNTAATIALSSGSMPAFTDAAAPAAIDSLISIAGASGTGGAFKISDTVTVTWNNSSTAGDVSSVTANLSQFGGGASVTMTDTTACSGTASNNIYEACYTILGSEGIDTTNRNASVSATDAATNNRVGTDTSNATVDTIVPTVTVGNITVTGASGTSGAFKNADTAVGRWDNSGTGDNNTDTIASVTINASAFDDGSSSLSGLVASGIYTATVGTLDSLDDTNNNITVTAVDNAGNSTATADTSNYTVDTIVPVVIQASITVAGATGTGGAFKNSDSPVLTWNPSTSGESDTIASATFNGASFKSGDTLRAGSLATNWTVSLSGAMDSQDDTGNTITVTVVDNAGNSTGPTTSSTSYTIDTTIPTVMSITYKDVTVEDGTVDRVDVLFSEDMSTGFVADKNEWTFPTAGTVTLTAPSLDASVTVSTTTVRIVPASAAANTTGGATSPTLSYTDTTGTLVDDAGNAPANFTAQTVADGAAPRVKSSASRYTLDNNSNGTVDYVKLVFTESLLDSSVAAGDFCVSTSSGACIAGDLTEAFTSTTPSSGNETDTANDATIYVGVSAGTQSITTNKTDYTLAVQVIGTVTDATPNTSSAEGSATNSTDGAAPVAISASYKDVTSVNGAVDRVDVLFTETITLSSYNASDWSFPVTSELTLADTGASVSTSTLLLTVSADANETGHSTAPTLRYTNNGNRLSDGTNNTATFASDITVTDAAGPFLISSSPADADQGVQANAAITLTFTEGINTSTFDYSCCGTALDPGGRATAWTVSNTVATISHNNFAGSSQVTINITTASDGTGNTFQGALTGAADPFTFTVLSAGDRAYRTEDGTTRVITATILSPNGGEILTGGTTATITWSATASGLASITLSYATNPRTYIEIASGEANDGSYEWTVPNVATTTVRVKVSAMNSDGQELVSDTSNGVFTITASSTSGADGGNGELDIEEDGPPLDMTTPDGVVVTLSEGSLFRGVTFSDVYVVKDGTRYVFPSESVYFSYYDSFDDVVTVNDDQLRKLSLGQRMTMAPGRMIKIQSDNRVFQTQKNGAIRHVPDEATARALYGSIWAQQITDISVVFWGDYTVKEALATLR